MIFSLAPTGWLTDGKRNQHVIAETGTFPAMATDGTGFTTRRTTSDDERTTFQ